MFTKPAPTMPAVLNFDGIELSIIDRNGNPWLAATELARALGFAQPDAVSKLYRRNAGEFTSKETETVNLGGSGNLLNEARIFSPRGCWLIAMLARTARSTAFRRWVLDVLEACGSTYDSTPSGLASAQRAYADWSHEAIARLKQAGIQPPQWPFAPTDHTGLATAVVSDLLARNRWVLSFDQRMQPHLSAVPQDAMILRAADLPEWISTGDIALKVLPAVLEAAGKRLGQALDARREPERLPAPAPVAAPVPARSQNLRADQWLQARTEATAAELIRDVLGGQPADRRLQMIAGQLFRANCWMPARRGEDRQRIWRKVA